MCGNPNLALGVAQKRTGQMVGDFGSNNTYQKQTGRLDTNSTHKSFCYYKKLKVYCIYEQFILETNMQNFGPHFEGREETNSRDCFIKC